MEPIHANMRKPPHAIRGFTARRRQAASPTRAALPTAYWSCFEGIVMSAMDAIVTVDGNHDIVVFNPAAEKMFGYAVRDIIGCPLAMLLPQRLRSKHDEHIDAFSASGATARQMGKLDALAARRADGTAFAAEASISHFQVGAKAYHTAILRDVTERSQTLANLQASEERERIHSNEMKNMLFAVPAAVCIAHDPDLSDITENELYRRWFGQSAPIGAAADGGFHKHPLRDALKEAANGREVRNYQFSDLKPDGTVRHLLGNAITIWGDDLAPSGAICAFVDVTERANNRTDTACVTPRSVGRAPANPESRLASERIDQ